MRWELPLMQGGDVGGEMGGANGGECCGRDNDGGFELFSWRKLR